MEEIRPFETTLYFSDVKDIYKPEIKELIYRELSKLYKNKCAHGMLILDILDILNHSKKRFVKDENTGAVIVDVLVNVKVLILNEGDIISGCKVVKIHSNGYVDCTQTHINVHLSDSNSPYLRGLNLKPDQFLITKIMKAGYVISKPQISAIGKPFFYEDEKLIYKIKKMENKNDDKDNLIMNEIIKDIKKIQNDIDNIDDITLKWTTELLNIPFPLKSDKYKHSINLLQLNNNYENISKDYLIRPIFNRIEPIAYMTDKEQDIFMETDVIDAITGCLNDYKKQIKLIYEMSTLFSNEELRKSHSNIWRIYNIIKNEILEKEF